MFDPTKNEAESLFIETIPTMRLYLRNEKKNPYEFKENFTYEEMAYFI